MKVRTGPRLSLAEQMARNPENKNRGRILTFQYCYARWRGTLRANEAVGLGPHELESLVARVRELRKIDLGIKMIKFAAGEFTFQGVPHVRHNGFKAAETKFTNGQFEELLKEAPEELAEIVPDPQRHLERSLYVVDPQDSHRSYTCPMVGLTPQAYADIAELLGKRLLTELEWERAAAGLEGKLDCSNTTIAGEGTRSVYAHWQTTTPEGALDLCGNAYEITSSSWGKIDLSNPNNPKFPDKSDIVVIRGCPWRSNDPSELWTGKRGWISVRDRGYDIGVRFGENLIREGRA